MTSSATIAKGCDLTDRGFQFNRDCGKAIEALMAKTATKS